MDNEKRKSLRVKTVFGIAIPLLIMVVTVVMVGASFAWFSDADKVTISTITLETAQAYSVNFDFSDGDLWKNTKYAGQTALASDGRIISSAMADKVNSPANHSNLAFSFVTVISLDTLDKNIDFTLSFDGASIYKNETVKDGDKETTNQIVYRNYKDDVQNIPYAFTWFFKEHVTGTVQNYEIDEDTKKEIYIAPQSANETWYTPYGKLTFDGNGYVEKINDIARDDATTANLPQKIVNFNTKDSGTKLYDFYIVFAPERLYWSQYFKSDMSYDSESGEYVAHTVDSLYGEELKPLITGDYSNQMYYSHMDYQGTTFSFSAMISVLNLDDAEGV